MTEINGETSSSEDLVTERLAKLDATLDKFQDFLEIPKSKGINDIDKYFAMSRDSLESMTPTKAAEAQFEIRAYSIHVQKAYNKNAARILWLEGEIKKIFGEESKNYSIYSYEEKKSVIIHNNTVAQKLNSMIIELQCRNKSIEHITLNLNGLCDSLKSIQYTKSHKEVSGF